MTEQRIVYMTEELERMTQEELIDYLSDLPDGVVVDEAVMAKAYGGTVEELKEAVERGDFPPPSYTEPVQ